MSSAVERAIEALEAAEGRLDDALDQMVGEDPQRTLAAREAAEEVVLAAWALAVRLGEGLDDDAPVDPRMDDEAVRAFVVGFVDGLRDREPDQPEDEAEQ
jgi:hypothetical protein